MADQSVDPNVIPLRAVLIVDIAATVDDGRELVNDAVDVIESRGMFCHYVTLGNLDPDEVVPGSALHEALTGQPAK